MSQFLPAKRCSIGQDKEKMLYYKYMSLEASLKSYNKKKERYVDLYTDNL